MRAERWMLLLLSVLLGAGPLASAQPTDTPRTGIIDNAGIVDVTTEQALNRYLEELEVRTKAQLKVLTVTTTRGRDIHDFGMEWAQRWRLGDAEEDNGVLVVIAVADRRWTIIVGEGVEDVLPDLLCKRIAERDFVPHFRRGDYSRGIQLGTIALVQKLAKSHNVTLAGTPPAPAQPVHVHSSQARHRESTVGPACVASFFFMIVILSLLSSAARMNRYRRRWGVRQGYSGLGQALFWGSLLSGMGRGGSGRSRGGTWSGGFGGGSFGGFGGGGFGGGGGGSFGGGAASGGW